MAKQQPPVEDKEKAMRLAVMELAIELLKNN